MSVENADKKILSRCKYSQKLFIKVKDKDEFYEIRFNHALFCLFYLLNGGSIKKARNEMDGPKVHPNTLKKNANIKRFMGDIVEDVFEKLGINLEYKVSKLKKVIDRSIPEEEQKKMAARDGISAIDLLNKMQGDYAPEKSEVDVRNDFKELASLIKKHEKEF